MADRYWIGNGGNWGDTAHWSDHSGGGGGFSVPGLSDNVFVDLNSFTLPNQVIILNTSCICINMDWSTVTNSPKLRMNNDVNLYGNLVLFGMTFDTTGTGRFLFRTTLAGQTIRTNGIVFTKQVIFNGTSLAAWQLQDVFTTSSSIEFQAGKLDLNGQTVTTGQTFSITGGGAKTLTMGNATINIPTGVSGYAFSIASGAYNYTIHADTSTINCRGITSFGSTPIALYDVNCTFPYSKYPRAMAVGTQYYISLVGFNSFHNLNITQTSSGTYMWQKTLAIDLDQDVTISGTLTLTGFGASTRRILIYSTVPGTQRTITAVAVSLTNVDFLDIAGAGVASPFTGTSLGDCGNNSGITFTPAVPRFWVGNGGNWSDYTNHWSAISGGSPGATLPLPQDNVYFDLHSFTLNSQSVVCDYAFLGGNIDWTGVTNNPKWTIYQTEGVTTRYILMFGNLTLDAGMSITDMNTSGDSTRFAMNGRGATTVTTNGVNVCGTLDKSAGAFIVDSGGGNVTLLDTLNCWNLGFRSGTLNANNQNLNLASFWVGYSDGGTAYGYGYDCTVNMGSGIWTFNGDSGRTSTGFTWYQYAYSGTTTINCNTSTIKINTNHLIYSPPPTFIFTSVATPDTGMGSHYLPTFYNVIAYGALDPTSYFIFDLRGTRSVTFHNMTITDARILVWWRSWTSSVPAVYTVTNLLDAKGTATNLIYFQSSSTTQAKLSAAVTDLAFINVNLNNALGAAIPFKDYGGVDAGSNTNWQFLPAPAVGGTGQVSWF